MSENKIENQEILKAINAFSQNNFKEAESICMQVLSNENNADANHIIGCIRMGEKKYDESIGFINKALKQKPDDIGILISLGCVLSSKKDYKESILIFKKIIKLKDDISQVYFYLGEALRKTEKLEDALVSFKKCLSISPDHIGCQLLIGIMYEELKKFDQAIESYKSCIQTNSDYPEPHIYLGMCFLLTGNYDEGWKEFQWRSKLKQKIYQIEFTKPEWKNEDLTNKTLVVIAEQSIGETFQHIRFVKQLAMEGARIIVVAPDDIIDVLKQQKWISDTIGYDDQIPEHDFYIYMINIARNLEWNPKMDTQKHPYLTAKKQEFTNCIKGKKNIGFMNKADISLPNYNQIRLPEDKINTIFKKSGHNIIDLSLGYNFSELSSILQQLDLFITIESDLCHLAGSLGVNTWLIIPVVPKYTWDINFKKSTPWYPCIELFRQEIYGDYNSVLKNIEQRLTDV